MNNELLMKSRHIRIVYLPPATVASAHFVGPNPEMQANQAIDQFVKSTNLTDIKPDLRHYGFNRDVDGTHGYEVWVTIPEDMEVPETLTKKTFKGGLYAAYMIPMNEFEEWNVLNAWLAENPVYEMNNEGKGQDCMFGALEEHINYFNHVKLDNTEPDDMQLDLLMPVREK